MIEGKKLSGLINGQLCLHHLPGEDMAGCTMERRPAVGGSVMV